MLSVGAVAEMQRPQADLHNAHGNTFGLTFFLPMYKGKRQVQRDGDIQSYHCMFTLYPEERVSVVAVTNDNAFDLEAVLHPIFDELLHLPEDTPPPRVIAPNTALWPDYTGSYLNPAWGLATIVADGGLLTLDLNGERTPLDAVKTISTIVRRPDGRSGSCARNGDQRTTSPSGTSAPNHSGVSSWIPRSAPTPPRGAASLVDTKSSPATPIP